MKRNQFTIMVLTFVSGIIIGISAIGLFSFTSVSPVPAASGISKISVQEANTLFRNYFSKAQPVNDIVKGFSLTRDNLAAINALANENASLTAFRVYMGSDNSGGSVGIVVGVSGSGTDVTGSVYRSASGTSGPCPTICDGNSAITVH